jgi:hypothetical protein
VDSNDLYDVTLHKLAISDRRGTASLLFNASDPGSSIRSLCNRPIDHAESIKVETTTLSGYIDRTVDFLKMDIEGSELAVIRELQDANKLSLIRKAAIEYHHHIVRGRDDLPPLLQILEQNNFDYHLHVILQHPRWRQQVQGIMIYACRR